LIYWLQAQGNLHITLAGTSWQLEFLARYFPALAFEIRPGYNVRYAEKGSRLKWSLLQQFPKITRSMRSEHQWLLYFSEKHSLHGIISDNCYGLWHPHIPNVILTHQLQIKSGMGPAADQALLLAHYRILQRFNAVWVVDNEANGLAGRLSHPKKLPEHCTYLGPVSQFYNHPSPSGQVATGPLLVLLSGPEPQRSLLSDILWQQVSEWSQPVQFVEGRKGIFRVAGRPGLQHFDQLQDAALWQALSKASLVICRSGYSSIMDLVYLNKKAFLIPTPGQTEQEYLARLYSESGIFPYSGQEEFSLGKALASVKNFPFRAAAPRQAFSGFEQVLEQWVAGL